MTLTASNRTDTATKIRPAAQAELEIVRDLILAVGLSENRAAITATFEGSSYWIARRDGVPVGTVGLEHGQGASLLRSAAVLPGARGGGVGRALALSALTQATLRGDEAVYLFSAGAGEYWQGFGFEEVTVSELVEVLPEIPQVQSGKRRGWLSEGWLSEERAWRKTLKGPRDARA